MRPMGQPRLFRAPMGWGTPNPQVGHAQGLTPGMMRQVPQPPHGAMPPQPAPVGNPGFGAGVAAGAIGAAAIGSVAALAVKSQENKEAAACRVDGPSWWQTADGQTAAQAKMTEFARGGTAPPGGWSPEKLVAATVEALAPGCLEGQGLAPLSGNDWMILGQLAHGVLASSDPPDGGAGASAPGTVEPSAPLPTIPGTVQPQTAEFQPQEPQTAEFQPQEPQQMQMQEPQGVQAQAVPALRLVAETQANPVQPVAEELHPNWVPKKSLWTTHHHAKAIAPVVGQVQLPQWAEHRLNVARYKLDQVKHAFESGQISARQKNGYSTPANAQMVTEYSAQIHDALDNDRRLEDWMQVYVTEAAHDVGSIHQHLQAQFARANVGQRAQSITTPRRRIQARQRGATP